MNTSLLEVRPPRCSPRLALLSLLILAGASGLHAQVPSQDVARGFQAERLYQFHDLDSVNLFNGNLTINIPIGQSYPNGGGMSYGLKLIYNSKVWDYRSQIVAPGQIADDPRGVVTGPERAELPVPGYAFNAGLGWSVSLGRLIAPTDMEHNCDLFDDGVWSEGGKQECQENDLENRLWAYESPDGAVHPFSKRFAVVPRPGAEQYEPETVMYARDGSNLRLRNENSSMWVDFPDGSSHEFVRRVEAGPLNDWRLSRMRDAFGNTVTVVMRHDEWTLTDQFGRITRLAFSLPLQLSRYRHPLQYRRLLEQISVPGPNGTPLVYRFVYDLGYGPGVYAPVNSLGEAPPGRLIPRGCTSVRFVDERLANVEAPFLTEVRLPDQTSYSFGYHYDGSGDPASGCLQGVIRHLQLPTGGRIRWAWDRSFFVEPPACGDPAVIASAQVTARVFEDGTATPPQWSYLREPVAESRCSFICDKVKEPRAAESGANEMRAIVLSPEGHKTEHYFSTHSEASPLQGGACFNYAKDEYGLPFSRSRPSVLVGGNQAYLSTVAYERTGTNADGTPRYERRRTTYVRYAAFGGTVGVGGTFQPLDMQVVAQRTQFHDDLQATGAPHYTETLHSDYDAFGHFRYVKNSSTFGPDVETITTYNDGCDADGYKRSDPARLCIAHDKPWLLNLYDRAETKSGGQISTSLLTHTKTCSSLPCFPGFLEKQVTYSGMDGVPSPTDVVVENSPGPFGFVAATTWRHAASNVPRYKVVNGYTDAAGVSAGTLTRSWYEQVTVDPSMPQLPPLPYDPSRRGLMTLDVTKVDKNTGVPLQTRDSAGVITDFEFDSAGRLAATRVAKANGSYIGGSTEYAYHSATGSSPAAVEVIRKDEVNAERGYSKITFDPFGRVHRTATRQFDGSLAIVERTHDSTGKVIRTTQAGTAAPHRGATTTTYDPFGRPLIITAPDGSKVTYGYSGARIVRRTSTIQRPSGPAPSTVVETHDALGRIVSVDEPSGPDESRIQTVYTYDVGNRLTRVETGPQWRIFEYDGVGRLLREDHPETAPIVYEGYDVKGHAGKRIVGSGKPFSLSYRYDDAERVVRVHDAADRALQIFTFDQLAGGPILPGRLLKAERHNYFTEGSTTQDYVVADYLDYDAAGRPVRKKTTVTDPFGDSETFTASVSLDYEGRPTLQRYPTCATCGVLGEKWQYAGDNDPDRAITLQYSQHDGALVSIPGFVRDITYHPSGLMASMQHVSRDGTPLVAEVRDPDPDGMPRERQITLTGASTCPGIAAQPADTWVDPSSGEAVFKVGILGTATVTWYEGEAGNTGKQVGTGPELRVRPSQQTSYWCRISDSSGCSVDSIAVVAFMCQPVKIIEPAIAADDTATFDVAPGANVIVGIVVDATQVTYRWERLSDGAVFETASFPQTINADIDYVLTLTNVCDRTIRRITIHYRVISACTAPVLESNLPPAIPVYQPGESLMLDVRVSNPAPGDSYVWRAEGPDGERQPPCGDAADCTRTVWDWSTVSVTVKRAACGLSTTSQKVFLHTFVGCALPPVALDQTVITLPAANLRFTAHCDRPDVTYEWFSGVVGDLRKPLPPEEKPNEQEVAATPGLYWLRVTAPCGTTATSEQLVVRSSSCGAIRFAVQPQSAQVAAGASVTLTAEATAAPYPQGGFTYEWYETSNPEVIVARGNILSDLRPLRTMSVVARASSFCSQNVDSLTATLHVTSCADVNLIEQPSGVRLESSTPATLEVRATAVEPLRYQWYMGESGDTSRPVANATSATLTVLPPATTRYWVRLYFDRPGSCAVDSRAVTVEICRAPVLKRTHTDFVSAAPGTRQWLAAEASGEKLRYEWFAGKPPADIAAHSGQTIGYPSPLIAVAPTSTSDYWVRVTPYCGPPVAVTFTVGVCPVIHAGPQSQSVVSGSTAQLSVAATGATSYEWRRGARGDVTAPVLGRDSAFTTPAVTAETTFWVRVYSGACYRDAAATISLCPASGVAWSKAKTQVSAGETQTLELNATPAADQTITWYQGDWAREPLSANILATGTSTTRTVSPQTTTKYWARVTRGACYADTSVLTVQVCVPQITAQPVSVLLNKTLDASATAELKVRASGDRLSYQWYRGAAPATGEKVEGATTDTLRVSPSSTTSYWVRVSGTCGYGADSATAVVTVCVPPSISAQPSSAIVSPNSNTSLAVVASGTNLTYQWYQGAAGITTTPVGNGGSSYTATTAYTADYWVRISGACGQIDSATARLSVKPVITKTPLTQRITRGTTATFTAAATGAHLRYEWFKGAQLVATTASGSYTTEALTTDATYKLRVYSGDAWIETEAFSAIVCRPPSAAYTPILAASGGDITLSVMPASGDAYTWYRGASGVSSTPVGTGPSVIVRPAVTTSYWVKSTNPNATCEGIGDAIVVRVCYPRIVMQPQPATVKRDSVATLSVAAEGTPPLSYQWYVGRTGDVTAPVANGTGASLTVTADRDRLYWVAVRSLAEGAGCETRSAEALVTAGDGPAIVTQPQSRQVLANAPVTLSVSATGTALQYQWYEGSSGVETKPISGARSASYQAAVAATTSFWVKVSNDYGPAVNSTTARMSVAPVITTQPADVQLTKGTTATFAVAASGNELSYQWYAGSVPISGATSSRYTTAPVQGDTSFHAAVRSGDAVVTTNVVWARVCTAPTPVVPTGWLQSGETVRLTIQAADGTSYAWYRGLPGDTTAPQGTGSFIDVAPAQTTSYWVRARSSICDADSAAVTVRMCYPRVTQHPQSVMVPRGSATTVSVSADGTPPLSYQWYIGPRGDISQPVSNATSNTLRVIADQTRTYWASVRSTSEGCGVYSGEATVTVCDAATIVTQPQSTTLAASGVVTLRVAASGTGLRYQWYQGLRGDSSNPVAGAVADALTTHVDATTNYWVRVLAACGTPVDSLQATVSVQPHITLQPTDTTICAGQETILSADGTGNALSFHWYYGPLNDTSKPIGSGKVVRLTNVAATTTVWCLIQSGAASIQTRLATVTVQPGPRFTLAKEYVAASGCYTLRVTPWAADAGKVTYVWYRGQPGDISSPVSNLASHGVCPTETPTTYWVRVRYTAAPSCHTDGIAITVP
jgi:hypothetical protein